MQALCRGLDGEAGDADGLGHGLIGDPAAEARRREDLTYVVTGMHCTYCFAA